MKITDELVVEGSVVGEISKPCRVEAVGDVIITGKVHHAEIRARTIHIGGEVRSSELVSCERIDVECDLIDVNVAAGDLEFCARRARDHQLRFEQHRAKLVMLKKQLERDEVQLHKQCNAPARVSNSAPPLSYCTSPTAFGSTSASSIGWSATKGRKK